MSFRQIFERIARIARAETGGRRSVFDTDFESEFDRELRRAQELIDESRRPRRGSQDGEAESSGGRAQTTHDPEYLRACRTLGVEPGATRQQITQAYRMRARDVHPDRVSHLSEPEQRAMLQRMQELNLAYEYLERFGRL